MAAVVHTFSRVHCNDALITDYLRSGFGPGSLEIKEERLDIHSAIQLIGSRILNAHDLGSAHIKVSSNDILRLASIKTFRFNGVHHILRRFRVRMWQESTQSGTYVVAWDRNVRVFHPLPPVPELPEGFPQVKCPPSGCTFTIQCSDGDIQMHENVLRSFPTWDTMLADVPQDEDLMLPAPLDASIAEMRALKRLYTEYTDPSSMDPLRLFELGRYFDSESLIVLAKGKIHLFAKDEEWQKVAELGRAYRDEFLIELGEALRIRCGSPASSGSAESVASS